MVTGKLFREKNQLFLGTRYCTEAHGVELQMLIDVCTRWNSLLQMVCRFLEIQKQVEKALIDYLQQEEILSESEIQQLRLLK